MISYSGHSWKDLLIPVESLVVQTPAWAGGAKSSCLPERQGPASGEWAMGLLTVAETAPRTKAGSSIAGPLEGLSICDP